LLQLTKRTEEEKEKKREREKERKRERERETEFRGQITIKNLTSAAVEKYRTAYGVSDPIYLRGRQTLEFSKRLEGTSVSFSH